MTENVEVSKHCKPGLIPQETKRSKLTLSLKSDSVMKCSGSSKSGLIFTGTLQDGLLKLGTENVCKRESICEHQGTITDGNGINKCETVMNHDVISIKSDSEEDIKNYVHSESKTNDLHVEDIKVVRGKSSSEDGLKIQPFENYNINKLAPVEKLLGEDPCEVTSSLQATCHTFRNTGPGRSGNNSPSLDVSNEMLKKLDTEECDTALKVEAWLHDQHDADVLELKDDNSTNDYEERRETSTRGVAQQVTSELASGSDVEGGGGAGGALQCPVCWKMLDKKLVQHLKLCAAKHKVSTRQLLEAVQLQRKQVQERLALGLPLVRPAATTAKPSAPRKSTSAGDANLQLGLALSASLQEAEELEQDHLLQLGIAEQASLSPRMVQKQLSLLEKFGFTTSRPTVPSSRSRPISKSRLKSYPLLNRTKEERERLITEKVAIVLMGEEDVEQAHQPRSPAWQHLATIASDVLLALQDKENQLWEMARDFSEEVNRDTYYVQSLASHISPCKVEPGMNLKRLSQLQDPMNTPIKSSPCKKIKLATPVASSKVKSDTQSTNKMKEKLKRVTKLLDFSPISQSSFAKSFEGKQKSVNHSDSLSKDWASVLNKQTMSDITIHVAGGREIPAHKLVFYVRCPALLYDLIKEESNGKVQELLMWVDVTYEAALAFLEFLYCGTMSRVLCLGDADVSFLKKLALQYQVMEVVQHLKIIHKVRTQVSHNGSYRSNTSLNSTSLKEDRVIIEGSFRKVNTVENSPFENCLQHNKISGSCSPCCDLENGSITPVDKRNTSACKDMRASQGNSPDMFDNVRHAFSPEITVTQESQVSANCLLSLMAKADASYTERTDEVEVTCSELQHSNNGLAMEKTKLLADLPSGACKTVLLEQEGPFDGEQNHSTSNESFARKILQGNIHQQTAIDVTENVSPMIDTQREISVNSAPAIKVAYLPTFDLTQSSSDEEVTEHETAQNGKSVGKHFAAVMSTNSEFPVEERYIDTDCRKLLYSKAQEVSPKGKHLDAHIGETQKEKAKEVDHSANSEPDVPFIDNVWDDFDDLGVVPNLLFYSSPSCNKMFGIPRNSESPDVQSSPRGSCSGISFGKRSRGSVKKKLKTSSTAVNCDKPPPPPPPPHEVSLPEAPRKADSSSSYKDLLEDSLVVDNWDSSVLLRGDTGCTGRGRAGDTPEEQRTVTDKVTPLPDYSTMKTPLLKKELCRYGLKPLKRKQAKQILRHIYDEMHPFVGKGNSETSSIPAPQSEESQLSKSPFKEPGRDTVVPKSPRKKLSASPSPKKLKHSEAPSQSCASDSEDLSQRSTCSSVSSDGCTVKEMIFEMETRSEAGSSTSEKDSVDFRTAVCQYIKSTPELYEKILQYEPIWLEELQANLKAQKLKFNLSQLMDYLDEKCITFRSARQQQSRARKQERKRKLSSISQKSRGRPRKKSVLSQADQK